MKHRHDNDRNSSFGHGHGHGHGKHRHWDEEAWSRTGIGRVLQSRDLRLLVLHFISDSPKHGYQIIRRIEELTGGAYSPSPGMVYPTLTLLEEMGHATTKTDGVRKLYEITETGRDELQVHQKMLEEVLQRIERIETQHAQDRYPPVIRAIENLKMALKLRRGQWTSEQLDQVVEILDEAVRRIERL
ncbi:MAG: PadR family transcriptional regulator [Phycisphaerae bacterium]|jgi:DNA-binding PadR family transcriptional regulator|nr:MAG: PadR family transcriptional regulator [Phycisphaerae bacterium]